MALALDFVPRSSSSGLANARCLGVSKILFVCTVRYTKRRLSARPARAPRNFGLLQGFLLVLPECSRSGARGSSNKKNQFPMGKNGSRDRERRPSRVAGPVRALQDSGCVRPADPAQRLGLVLLLVAPRQPGVVNASGHRGHARLELSGAETGARTPARGSSAPELWSTPGSICSRALENCSRAGPGALLLTPGAPPRECSRALPGALLPGMGASIPGARTPESPGALLPFVWECRFILLFQGDQGFQGPNGQCRSPEHYSRFGSGTP